MEKTTRAIIDAALAADRTVHRPDAERALRLLDGNESEAASLGRVVRIPEACSRLGVTSKTLRLWSAQGALVPVYGAQRRRRVGYTEASVRAVLAGKGGVA